MLRLMYRGILVTAPHKLRNEKAPQRYAVNKPQVIAGESLNVITRRVPGAKGLQFRRAQFCVNRRRDLSPVSSRIASCDCLLGT